MLLLFVTLILRGEVSSTLRHSASGLLQHLSLLVVPAGVGVMVHGALISAEWLPIVVALDSCTALTMMVSAVVLRASVSRSSDKSKSS